MPSAIAGRSPKSHRHREGTYQINIRYASFPADAALYITINDSPGIYVSAQSTQGDQTSLTATLSAGDNKIRLHNDHGPMPDVDWMKIVKR